MTNNLISQQTTELNEKLHECYRKLREAEAENRETQREIKLKEVIATLQRIFPAGAVKGRVSDLCKPVQRKYDKAISVALGKNIDSIVVDTQQTALDCVNVSSAPDSIRRFTHSILTNCLCLVPERTKSRYLNFSPSRYHNSKTHR